MEALEGALALEGVAAAAKAEATRTATATAPTTATASQAATSEAAQATGSGRQSGALKDSILSHATYELFHQLVTAALLPALEESACQQLALGDWGELAGSKDAAFVSTHAFLNSLVELGEMWTDQIARGPNRPEQVTAFLTRLLHHVTTQRIERPAVERAALGDAAALGATDALGGAGGELSCAASSLTISSTPLRSVPPVRERYSLTAATSLSLASCDKLQERLTAQQLSGTSVSYRLVASPAEVAPMLDKRPADLKPIATPPGTPLSDEEVALPPNPRQKRASR